MSKGNTAHARAIARSDAIQMARASRLKTAFMALQITADANAQITAPMAATIKVKAAHAQRAVLMVAMQMVHAKLQRDVKMALQITAHAHAPRAA